MSFNRHFPPFFWLPKLVKRQKGLLLRQKGRQVLQDLRGASLTDGAGAQRKERHSGEPGELGHSK